MSRLESALRELVGHLSALGTRFAVVGGLAVSARTEPRFTRDADVCVAVDTDAEAEALIRRLGQQGYEVRALVEQEAVGRIATARLVTTAQEAEGVVLDLLFASSGIEPEVVEASEIVDLFEGLSVPLATVPSLLAQKILARDDMERPQDRMDIAKLLEVAGEGDLLEVERLLALIEARGFARQRVLTADLRKLRDEFEDAQVLRVSPGGTALQDEPDGPLDRSRICIDGSRPDHLHASSESEPGVRLSRAPATGLGG